MLSGPSGVGKDALLHRMRETGAPYHFAITATTRPMRPDERDGVDYIFVTRPRFEQMIGDDDLLELCGAKGIAFVPFFAVATASGASPDGPVTPGQAQIGAIAEKYDASSAQIRLAWTLHRGPHVLAIPGTGNPAHVEQNIASASLRLGDADIATLDAIAAG